MQQEAGQLLYLLHIRFRFGDLLAFLEDAQQIPPKVGLHRSCTNGLLQFPGHRNPLEIIGREVHFQKSPPAAPHGEVTAEGVKRETLLVRLIPIQQHRGGGQRGVAAQVDLPAGREPPEPVAIRLPPRERRLRQSIFPCNAHHGLLRQPLLQNADRRWVPMEELLCKRVYNKLFHG